MLGLFGTLEMARQSLQVAQHGVQLAGHNLANAANPAYARQRLQIETAETIPSPIGAEGTGAQVTGYHQIRDQIVDRSIIFESSISSYLQEKERSLTQMETYLGQTIDRQSSANSSGTVGSSTGGQYGLAEGMAEFFNTFQSLSVSPSSTADRQVAMLKARQLADKFKDLDSRLLTLKSRLNEEVSAQAEEVNKLLAQIAELSNDIKQSEIGNARANEVRDRRQEKLEALAKLTDIQVTDTETFNVSVNGVTFVHASVLIDSFKAVADGNGSYQLTSAITGGVIGINSGKLKGILATRDTSITSLRSKISLLAQHLITEVNARHSAGKALDGSTGRAFFTGTDGSNISVNTALEDDPRLIQVSGNGDAGDNTVALNLARLAGVPLAALGNRTFSDHYNVTVTSFGQELSDVKTRIGDQAVLDQMLTSQRESVSGVSVDDEMTHLITFQRAYQASSRLIGVLDELLLDTIQMGAR